MKLYLVRHGQSIGNVNKIHQNADTPLSELGRSQATELAKRFKSIPIELILTSHFTRAMCTAEIVSKKTGISLEINELLRELKMPCEVEGRSTTDPEVADIKHQLIAHLDDKAWHLSDEENAYDLMLRAATILSDVANRQEKSILVVSHGTLIRTIIGVVLFGDLFTPHLLQMLKSSLFLSNTGITRLEYIEDKWQISSVNDDAHLGNL